MRLLRLHRYRVRRSTKRKNNAASPTALSRIGRLIGPAADAGWPVSGFGPRTPCRRPPSPVRQTTHADRDHKSDPLYAIRTVLRCVKKTSPTGNGNVRSRPSTPTSATTRSTWPGSEDATVLKVGRAIEDAGLWQPPVLHVDPDAERILWSSLGNV